MLKDTLIRPDDVKIRYLSNFCGYCLPLFTFWTYQFKIRLPTGLTGFQNSKSEY